MSVFKKVLTVEHKRANAEYFDKIIKSGAKFYMWKDIGELFTLNDEKLQGTQRGVDACKQITPISFHHKFVVKEKNNLKL